MVSGCRVRGGAADLLFIARCLKQLLEFVICALFAFRLVLGTVFDSERLLHHQGDSNIHPNILYSLL